MTRNLIAPGTMDLPAQDWKERLDLIVTTMREMSRHTDPQAMVRDYQRRIRQILPANVSLSLSRRGLEFPFYRITRSTTWADDINPWQQQDRLPMLRGGLLAKLIYGNEPIMIESLDLAEDDPAEEFLRGMKSVMALPLYDQGESLNMVIVARDEPAAFNYEQFPELVWMSSLFGRATHNLVLRDEIKKAYDALDHEMKVVSDIQRSLLPERLPEIPTMDLGAHYETSSRAGGDYYDIFSLPDNKWGLIIADVSGHGTPAAVVMAILHSIVHSYSGPPTCPSEMLNYLNRRLEERYTANGTFVTAFYGIYNADTREMIYATAGHPPPRIKRCSDGSLVTLNQTSGLPLGVFHDTRYNPARAELKVGDQIVFYTDGITEASSPTGALFGEARLDHVLHDCRLNADDIIQSVLHSVESFTQSEPISDDRTILVAKIK